MDIISYVILRIDQLGEQGQEAKNKEFKLIWEHMTRPDSAIHNHDDILNILLLSSDPLIPQILLKKKHEKNHLNPEAIRPQSLCPELCLLSHY